MPWLLESRISRIRPDPGCWCFPIAAELAGTRQPMPALGWVPVRKEAESLSQSVCSCPSTPNQGPQAPWMVLPADLGALRPWHWGSCRVWGVSSCVRSCSAVTVQEPSVAGTQCCGQSCYRGPLDVPRAVVALWLSPGGAFPQPLPVYDDACGFPACRGSWQCPWDSLPLGPCHSTWGSRTLPRVLVSPSPGEALVPR